MDSFVLQSSSNVLREWIVKQSLHDRSRYFNEGIDRILLKKRKMTLTTKIKLTKTTNEKPQQWKKFE